MRSHDSEFVAFQVYYTFIQFVEFHCSYHFPEGAKSNDAPLSTKTNCYLSFEKIEGKYQSDISLREFAFYE